MASSHGSGPPENMHIEKKPIRLSAWAKNSGMTYRTALYLFHRGRLPVHAEQFSPTGRIMVYPETTISHKNKINDTSSNGAVLYAWVDAVEKQHELKGQVVQMTEFAANASLPIIKVVEEVGEERFKLREILANGHFTVVIVANSQIFRHCALHVVEPALVACGRNVLFVSDAGQTSSPCEEGQPNPQSL